MTKAERMEACREYFNELVQEFGDEYEIMTSCNQDLTSYLIPVGTSDQNTYESKPELSFRMSDHWNWYANVDKCPQRGYLQCRSTDLPWPRRRLDDKATKPIYATCVALFINGDYKVIFGERFDRETKTWTWINYLNPAYVKTWIQLEKERRAS